MFCRISMCAGKEPSSDEESDVDEDDEDDEDEDDSGMSSFGPCADRTREKRIEFLDYSSCIWEKKFAASIQANTCGENK